MGFEVLLSDNPSEFNNLYSNTIDVIVLNLFMPKVDGVELLRFLADNNSKASVVFISGKDPSVLRSAKELGINVKKQVN